MFAMINDERASWKITSRLEKKPLLIAVNGLAGLAIFFFGQRTPISSPAKNTVLTSSVEPRRL